jgi:hypothetical protein
VGVGLV